MRWRWVSGGLRVLLPLAMAAMPHASWASEYHGQVTLGGLPVPGATVSATAGGKTVTTTTDTQGLYSFPGLADGTYTVRVEMTGFAPLTQEVPVAAEAPAGKFELKMLSVEEIRAVAKAVKLQAPATSTAAASTTPAAGGKAESAKPQEVASAAPPPPAAQEETPRNPDGVLINGSVNNAATSQFSQASAFGNNRTGGKGLYTGGLGVILENSALDAKPYSLTGLDTPKPAYNRVTSVLNLGGPLKIPHLLPRGPNFFLGYQWTRNQNDSTQSALVPTAAQRSGVLSTGVVTPASQAAALLQFYPLPNLAGSSRYNYQTAIVSETHQDALQSRLDKQLGRNQFNGGFAFQDSRSSGANLFGFVDTTDSLGLTGNVNWSRRFKSRFYSTLGYRYSRSRNHTIPYFEGRENVSQAAGITGNDQDAADWGPPSLSFSSGIAGLSDANSSYNRNQTNAVSYSLFWNKSRHNVTVGADLRRQEFNYFAQQNPRGSFTFTGAATQGANTTATDADFGDFLIGVPDVSSIAYGNADKYFRQTVYDAFVTDDWRIRPDLTINFGMRWEYGAPITELFGRLVNLDVAPGFTAVAAVLGSKPVGSLTGQSYPASLVRQDKRGFEPRVGLSWRPFSGSSVVVRAGYGIYDDTSVYQATASQMAQQAPLSKSLSVQNSAACPLTLAMGFNPCSSITQDTFAVDPNFRVGYAQTWQLAVQRDLPASLQMTATYLGVKGTRGVQQELPNTYPLGASNPCASCPTGFVYRTSGGDSTRESGNLRLRRRLRAGFTATLAYTYSKSLDDDAVLGGQGPNAAGATSQNTASAGTAQNWLNLRGERGLSTFDQRNLLTGQAQYTTGMGIGGRTLMSGWKGALYKEWTVLTNITVGSGLPETPVYFATVTGTGQTSTIRPNVTGASISAAPAGLHLNPAAFAAPASGQWGDARRDSITGPGQFGLNASMSRTFRLHDRYNLDIRLDSTNTLNHVTYSGWLTTVNSSQFGLPAGTNGMRTTQLTTRLRF
jgi:hypothetical protein